MAFPGDSLPVSALPLVTIPPLDRRKILLERMLGLRMVSISQQNFLPRGLCYWNVDAVMRRHGGSMVMGWQCLWWPERLMVAMHHAVWRKPNGQLLDVTYKDSGDISLDTSFCEDTSLPVDLLWPVFIPNKYINLLNDKHIGNTIIALTEQVEATAEVAAYVRINGGVYLPGTGLSLPSGELPKYIKNRVHKANARRRIALARCQEHKKRS
jgi:hypothetical protein